MSIGIVVGGFDNDNFEFRVKTFDGPLKKRLKKFDIFRILQYEYLSTKFAMALISNFESYV